MNDPALPLTSCSEERAPSDSRTLRQLYQAHAATVRRLLLRLGVRDADVDDLVHDAFVVAARRNAEFEGRSSARTWLCGIAVKLAAAHRRRRRARELFAWRSAHDLTHDDGSPLRSFEQSEAKRVLQRALDGLSTQKRAVLVLYEIEQLSGEEIAEIVDCPLKTVWTRLFYARREFAAVLRSQGLLDEEEGEVRKVDRS